MRYVVLFSVCLTMAFFAVFGEKGLLQMFRLSSARTAAKTRLVAANGTIDNMRRERDALKDDRQVMERMARLSFGLARSNEVIYIIDRPQ